MPKAERDTRFRPITPGLNLILLAVSVVVHWSYVESLLAVTAVLLMYAVACSSQGEPGRICHSSSTTIYFLVLTGIMVVTGNYVFNRLRFREFALRLRVGSRTRRPWRRATRS